METPYVSQNTRRTSRAKFAATLAIAVLGSLAVSYLVFSNMPAETELIVRIQNTRVLKDLYAGWKKAHNINYGGPEDNTRFKVFTQTYMTISKYNAQNLTFTLGLNEFSAMTDEEFSSTKLGEMDDKPMRLSGSSSTKNYTMLATDTIKDSVDWTTKGVVTPVKNQGNCGSCWSFAATGALEGLSGLQDELQSFSEQELVDCAGGSYGNNGCNGGLALKAFNYVKDHGIGLESDYPYTATDGKCKFPAGSRFKIGGVAVVTPNSASALKAALNQQPVAVSIQADSTVFRNYKSGVITGSACGTTTNHAVLAVGYETSGTPHYKVKNSWGTGWGDKGFVKIGIEEYGLGVCGIQKRPVYPAASD